MSEPPHIASTGLSTHQASDGPDQPPSGEGRVTKFLVDGLCCAAEARQIEARLGPDPGVRSLRIDPVQHTLHVEGEIAGSAVQEALAELGMTARPGDAGGARLVPQTAWYRSSRAILAISSGLLWLASVAVARTFSADFVAGVAALGAVIAGGWYVFPRGYRAARNRVLDMNFLMSAAAVGALLIGEYAEAASVMFLFAVAQLLERASMDRARNAIRALMELAPTDAAVMRGGRELRVPADQVRVGETVIVRPGEKIPVDGVVTNGSSAVVQAAITGESLPVAKSDGDEVFAGTLNGDGALEVRSSHASQDTTLARIIHSVEEAQASKAPSQTFVDRFARTYTPAVVAAAVLVALGPPVLTGADWSTWIYRALALLVVSCPCALVISTPVTVVSALAGAARRGILIKGGLHLEMAGRVRVVAFDKTGTLTEGRPEVVTVLPRTGITQRRILELAAAVEARSEHPLAAAIVAQAREEGVVPAAATDTRALPGRGATAVVEGRRIVVGSPSLFEAVGVEDLVEHPDVRRLRAEDRTVVFVGISEEPTTALEPDLRVVGAIALADRIRTEASAAVQGLRASGIEHVTLLTGDNPSTARAVARVLGDGLTEVRAGLLPDDKVAAVSALRDAHGPVLMVGDGVNDAPALAASDVGVAMGAAGTDVALETADIALMADDLSGLPVLIRLARKAERIIRWNIGFALAVKAVFVVLAVTGLATLWMAVLADMGASLLVIANGMRGLRVPKNPFVVSPPGVGVLPEVAARTDPLLVHR